MDENQRKFTGVFIPAEIYENQELSWTDKILWAEIQALSGSDCCYANNTHFAKHLGIDERNVIKHLSVLKRLGLVEILSFDGRVRKMKAVLFSSSGQTCQNRQGRPDENVTPLYNDEIQTKIQNENNICGIVEQDYGHECAYVRQNGNICKKRSVFNFNGKTYCGQHFRMIMENILKNTSDPNDSSVESERIKNIWNNIAQRWGLAEIRALTADREKKLKLRLKEQNMTLEQFFDEIRTALEDSPFLRGKRWHEIIGHPNDSYWEDTDWRADFDFFLQPSSLQKAIEGKYADPTLRKERLKNQK